MSTIKDRLFADALIEARAFLNDPQDDIYHNEFLLPFAVHVHAEIQDEYKKNDIPTQETVTPVASPFPYTADATTIPVPGSITDFHSPIELWEKPTGSTTSWRLMVRANELPAPPVVEPQWLAEWEWRGDAIVVNPCNRAMDILVRYQTQLDYPASTAQDTVGSEGYYWPLSYGTAAQAALATGRDELASANQALYAKRLKDAINIAARKLQGVPVSWGGYNDDWDN